MAVSAIKDIDYGIKDKQTAADINGRNEIEADFYNGDNADGMNNKIGNVADIYNRKKADRMNHRNGKLQNDHYSQLYDYISKKMRRDAQGTTGKYASGLVDTTENPRQKGNRIIQMLFHYLQTSFRNTIDIDNGLFKLFRDAPQRYNLSSLRFKVNEYEKKLMKAIKEFNIIDDYFVPMVEHMDQRFRKLALFFYNSHKDLMTKLMQSCTLTSVITTHTWQNVHAEIADLYQEISKTIDLLSTASEKVNNIDIQSSCLSRKFIVLLFEMYMYTLYNMYRYFISLMCLACLIRKNQSKRPFILNVISSNVFRNAMDGIRHGMYELAYTRFFPSNCRMFIDIPINRFGFLGRSEKKGM